MSDKLNYQQAKRIREQSLSSVLADQLIMGEGYGSGLAKSISLKTRARITGIKQKFDPLNIAKFLTGGSRLGPAIVGKMLGRSRKDIEFFAGRARPVTSRNKKIGALPGGEDTTGMTTVLEDILTFLHRSHEDDMVLREKENNLREGEKHEDDRRHKDLLKALGVKVQGPTATPVKQEEGGNMFGDLLERVKAMIAQAMEGVREMIDKAIEGFKWLKDTSLFRWLATLASPFALIAAISAAIFGGTAMLQNAELQRLKDLGGEEALSLGEQRQQQELQNAGDPGAVGAAIMNANEESSSEKIVKAIAKKQAVVEQIMNEQGFSKTGVDKHGAFEFKNKEGKPPAPELLKVAYIEADKRMKSGATPEKPKGSSTSPTSSAPSTTPNNSNIKPVSSAEPVSSAPTSAAVAAKTNENMKLNLQSVSTPANSTITNNSVVNKTQTQQRKIAMPSVRNMEETFQRTIYNSTRVV
jgi:hypothetical protein